MPLILPNDIANEQDADGDLLQQNFATIEDWGNQEAITRDGATAMTGALLLPGPPTQPDQAATKGYVDATGLIGEIKMFGGDAEPANWMFCRGQQISRATYAALFAVYGTKYGAGDGSTTFNVPSLAGRMPIGYYPGGGWAATLGQLGGTQDAVVVSHGHGGATGTISADHTHTFSGTTAGQNANHYHNASSGDIGFVTQVPGTGYGQGAPGGNTLWTRSGTDWTSNDHGHSFSGSTSGVSSNHTHAITTEGVSGANANLPPYVVVNFIVKVS